MLSFYNTLTKKIRVFKPLKKGKASIYSCGPTVYDYPHIGNLRRYVTDDILYRTLKKSGLKVKRIINITDVGHLTQDDLDTGEDKIIKAAKKEGKSPLAIAQFYTNKFLSDAAAINLAKPDRYAKATDHIKEMQEIVKKLIEKKYAYEVDGTVYFDVSRYKDYGKLSGNTLENLRQEVRPELKKSAFRQKRSAADFVLWVKAAPDHLLQWPSPWGRGYPGWHIECAAIVLTNFGPTVDIHTGGQDNIFPHHEDEIAEAGALNGKPLARYWLHTKHLLVNRQKMSKRNGSLIILDDVIKKGYSPLAFRLLVLEAHYSSPLNFTWDAQKAAQEGWERIRDYANRLRQSALEINLSKTKNSKMPQIFTKKIEALRKAFDEAIDNDLGTPQALAVLSKLISFGNSELRAKGFNLAKQEALLSLLLEFDDVLALLPNQQSNPLPANKEKKISEIIQKRLNLKKQKKYAQADLLRNKLIKLGFDIEDKVSGTRWEEKKTGRSGLVQEN